MEEWAGPLPLPLYVQCAILHACLRINASMLICNRRLRAPFSHPTLPLSQLLACLLRGSKTFGSFDLR